MARNIENVASNIMFDRFDPVLDSYMDIFADKSITKEATKEGMYGLLRLRACLIVLTFTGAVVDCDVYDKGLDTVLKHVNNRLITFRNGFIYSGDINALISNLEDVIQYITEQRIQYVPKEDDKTTARAKKAKGFGWNSNYWGGLN